MQHCTIVLPVGTFHAPTTPNDLTTAQLLHLYAIAGQLPQSASPQYTQALYLQLLEPLTGISPAHIEALRRQLYSSMPHTDADTYLAAAIEEITARIAAPFFTLDPQGEPIALALTLTRCPYPELITPDGLTWYAAADGLENCTLLELATIFTLLEQQQASPSPHIAAQLLASIYRPHKPRTAAATAAAFHGDVRQPYSEHTTPQRQGLFEQLPPTVTGLLLWWLSSCRATIAAAYPNLFKAPTVAATIEHTGNDYGWAAILVQLAGGIVHLPAVERQQWQNAFIYMSFLEDQRKLAELRQAAAQAQAPTRRRR